MSEAEQVALALGDQADALAKLARAAADPAVQTARRVCGHCQNPAGACSCFQPQAG